MKFIKFCIVLLIVAGFSSCEIQGEVVNIVKGTPTKADTVLPRKFAPGHHHADSAREAHEENVPSVFKR